VSALVTLTRVAEGVSLLEMSDAAGKNAFSDRFVDELIEALDDAALDPEARALVLAGLPGVFCSGATQELLRRLVNGAMQPADIVLARQLLDLPIPVIAAMEGHATGGGLALGLCADIIVMARESRYGCTFLDMGFTPGMGTTRLLEHVLSPAVAHELLYTGELRRGSDFEARTGINHVLPRDQVRPRALDLALRIAAKPRPALVMLKRTLSLRRRQAFEESRTLEALMHEVCFADPAVRRGIEENYVR
jgi:polyketide biosynthesis enoyl-CoA hydratase PksI